MNEKNKIQFVEQPLDSVLENSASVERVGVSRMRDFFYKVFNSVLMNDKGVCITAPATLVLLKGENLYER